MPYTRNQDDLHKLLKMHCNYIARSCEMYDSGDFDESARIAVSLRVIFHDKNSSKSLVSQLGKQTEKMYSSGAYGIPRPGLISINGSTLAMLQMRYENDVLKRMFVPNFDEFNTAHIVDVSTWWEDQVVAISGNIPASRKNIVLMLSDKDGAHVDPRIHNEYLTHSSLGISFIEEPELGHGVSFEYPPSEPQELQPFEESNFLQAAVRQIAFEFMGSDFFKGYFRPTD